MKVYLSRFQGQWADGLAVIVANNAAEANKLINAKDGDYEWGKVKESKTLSTTRKRPKVIAMALHDG